MKTKSELRERYETTMRIYVEKAKAVEAALGEVRPLGRGEPVPMISRAWIDAVAELQKIEPEYEEARDAYWGAETRSR